MSLVMFLCFEADELSKTKLKELYSPANKNYYPDRIIVNPGGGGGGGNSHMKGAGMLAVSLRGVNSDLVSLWVF